MTTSATLLFTPLSSCWICGGARLAPVHELRFDLEIYGTQDPELAAYSGQRLALRRCDACGFAQPGALPSLPRFFDRLYDQRWSDEWIANEFHSPVKDLIFSEILQSLARRLPADRRRLLDVGAHAGRFLVAAREAGWRPEGLELNPKTAGYAATRAGAVVHQGNVHTLDPGAGRFDAIAVTDVLEHVPEPLAVLERVRALLDEGGWVAIKVPNGPIQRFKEQLRARLVPGYRATLADNLVHVNHFSPGSLRLALRIAGFSNTAIVVGAPELPPGGGAHGASVRAARRALFQAARVTGGASSPLAFNLQAYARR
jgi:SAM-dependent methyltransferase